MKIYNVPFFYFDGDANDPSVQLQIRNNFYNLATSPYLPPIFCKHQPQCKKENVAVYAGEAGMSIYVSTALIPIDENVTDK